MNVIYLLFSSIKCLVYLKSMKKANGNQIHWPESNRSKRKMCKIIQFLSETMFVPRKKQKKLQNGKPGKPTDANARPSLYIFICLSIRQLFLFFLSQTVAFVELSLSISSLLHLVCLFLFVISLFCPFLFPLCYHSIVSSILLSYFRFFFLSF